jgi:hypothetical protein
MARAVNIAKTACPEVIFNKILSGYMRSDQPVALASKLCAAGRAVLVGIRDGSATFRTIIHTLLSISDPRVKSISSKAVNLLFTTIAVPP